MTLLQEQWEGQWEAIEANLYFFILDNDHLDPAHRPVLDAIYEGVAIAASKEPRELPPHKRVPRFTYPLPQGEPVPLEQLIKEWEQRDATT